MILQMHERAFLELVGVVLGWIHSDYTEMIKPCGTKDDNLKARSTRPVGIAVSALGAI